MAFDPAEGEMEGEGEGGGAPGGYAVTGGGIPGPSTSSSISSPQQGNNLSLSADEWMEYQKLKKMAEQQRQQSQHQHQANPIRAHDPPPRNAPRLVLSIEENKQYQELVKKKQLCLKQMNKYKKDFTTEKFKEIGNDLAVILVRFEDVYSNMLEEFENCEIRCNKQWDLSNIENIVNSGGDGGRVEKIDTIKVMKEKIEEFEMIDEYMSQAKADLERYLLSVVNDLSSLSENVSNAVSMIQLCKDKKINIDKNVKNKDDDNKGDDVAVIHDKNPQDDRDDRDVKDDRDDQKNDSQNRYDTINGSFNLDLVKELRELLKKERLKNSNLERELRNLQDNYDAINQHAKKEEKVDMGMGAAPRDDPAIVPLPKPINGRLFNVKVIAQWKYTFDVKSNGTGNKPKAKGLFKSKSHAEPGAVGGVGNGTASGRFFVCNGSVLNFSGDAIINATNETCIGQYGVDGAITKAGGRIFRDNVMALPIVAKENLGGKIYEKRLLPGAAAIVKSGLGSPDCSLPCKNVILAVGPRYYSGYDVKKSDQQLYDTYAACMKIARENNLQSVGFCLIGAGIFRGHARLPTVLEIGVQAIKDSMYKGAQGIFMIAFTKPELTALTKAATKVFGKPTAQGA